MLLEQPTDTLPRYCGSVANLAWRSPFAPDVFRRVESVIFAPVGELVPAALAATGKGATVVCAGIHMSDIPSFPYRILWEERVLRSVAILTRRDAEEFLALAPEAGIRTETVTYPLARANDALADLRNGALQGAAVLIP